MSTNAMPRPSTDYPKAIWESATALSAGAQSAAIRKVREVSFDENQGDIPFEETLINLSTVRDVLLDTVEKGRLTQLPLRLQARLLGELNRIVQALVELGNGKDTIRVLENYVEELNSTIYQLNLQNQSESILGFERKMNELKAEEVIVKRSMSRATRLVARSSEIESLFDQVTAMHQTISQLQGTIQSRQDAIESASNEIDDTNSKVKGILGVVREYETALSQASSSGRSSAAELSVLVENAEEERNEIAAIKLDHETHNKAMLDFRAEMESAIAEKIEALDESTEASEKRVADALALLKKETQEDLALVIREAESKIDAEMTDLNLRIKASVDASEAGEKARSANAKAQLLASKTEFEEYLSEITEQQENEFKLFTTKSNSQVEKNNSDTQEITVRLNKLEDRIRDAIERATGYTLFHSFQKRQEDLKASSRFWIYALGLCVLGSAAATLYFIHFLPDVHEYKAAFYIKLSLSIPFLFALTFCSLQYTRERRLEEEYAFKSSISISLEPYQKLVESLIDTDDPGERAKYTAFIIASINRVFTSPTGLVFDADPDTNKQASSLLKTAGDVAKDLIKAKSS